jgi:hypothetical protein
MVPFVEEFKCGENELLGSAHTGDYAIVMSLDGLRALLIQVDGSDGPWVYGRAVFPKLRFPKAALPFSRSIHTPCVILTSEQAQEMADRYESMFVKYD